MDQKAHRKTNQKDFVHQFVLSTFAHPTAFDVVKAAKKAGVKLGVTSAYRILNEMVLHGEAIPLVGPDAVVHYDAVRDDHFHFICRSCGKIIDLKGDEEQINQICADQHLSLDHLQSVAIYGLCSDCQEKALKERAENGKQEEKAY
jgi:Fur family peroxide stress response transcriptional regulator